MSIVIKRNGSQEDFDWKKVERSIRLAANSAKVPITDEELASIRFEVPESCGVEYILDNVIKELYSKGLPVIADSFMLHRERRRKEREIYKALVKSIADISVKSAKDVDLKRENANINGDTAMGQMLRIGSEAAKSYYLNYVIDPKIAEAHISGDIHIHDLDFYPMTTTCCQIDVGDLLSRGFDTGHGSIRPPKTIRTACNLACIIIQSNQNDQHGGQSIPNFDRMLAPFVDKTVTHFYQKYIESDIVNRKGYDNPEDCPEVQDYRSLVKEKGLALKYTDENRQKPDISTTYQAINGMKDDDWLYNFYQERKIVSSGYQQWQEMDVRNVRNNAYLNAVHDTEQDCMQGMEALVHNLNTMHCLPGDERVWVLVDDEMKTLTVEQIYNAYKINDGRRFKVYSINKKTGKVELKDLTAVMKVGNHRDLIKLTTECGQVLTTTDDHRYISYDENGFKDVEAKDVKNVLVPSGSFNDVLDVDYMSPEFAELLGVYLKSGAIIEDTLVCYISDGGFAEDEIVKIVNAAFNETVPYTKEYIKNILSTEYRFKLGVSNCKRIYAECGDGTEPDHVPTSVIRSSASNVKSAFINGMIFTESREFYRKYGLVLRSRCLVDGVRLVLNQLREHPFVEVEDLSTTYYVNLFKAYGQVLNKEGFGNLVSYCVVDKERFNSGEEYVYDLSVADNENFLTASGIFVHNSRAGAQVPFSSINFGTDTSPAGRLVTKCLLQAQENGLGMGETPIFPILIYRLKDGVNTKKGDVNYDLFQQALRCSSKRMFPNFSFQDATFNKRYYDESKPETEIAYMGAVTGDNVILIKDGEDRKLLTFEEAYDLYHDKNVEIWDSFHSWVPVKKWMKFPDGGDWYEVTFDDWRTITMTSDHPLPTQRGRIECANLKVGDSVDLSSMFRAGKDVPEGKEIECLEDAFNYHYNDRRKFIDILINNHCYVEDGAVKALFGKDVALKVMAIAESIKSQVKVRKLEGQFEMYELTFLSTPTSIPLLNEELQEAFDNCSLERNKGRVTITKIEFKGRLNKERYDVETESDRFDVSGIYSCNCRTRVIGNVYDPSREIVYARGNLSFTTINLPRLAYYFSSKYGQITPENREDKLNIFLSEYLQPKLELVEKQLLERFALQSARTVKNFPFLMKQGVWLDSEKLGENDKLEEVLKHGTLSIGFIGLAETLRLLVGKHHGESEFAEQVGLSVIRYMREFCDAVSQEKKLNFTLLATPSEGLCARVLRLDRQKFGVIPGYTDKEYITNSFHVPVEYNTTFSHKIDVEAPYHELTNAGHISYIELDGDAIKNLDAFERIVLYMKEKNMGYCAVNHPIDFDPVCGFRGVIGETCPKCGRKETEEEPFTRIRRITGYLVGGLDRFNDGKRDEERRRVKHSFGE